MQYNAKTVFERATENGLQLKTIKTWAIIFQSTRNLTLLPNSLPPILMDGSSIPYVEQFKILGLPMALTLVCSHK